MNEFRESVSNSIRKKIAESGEGAQKFLAERFVSQTMVSLFHARRKSGLTQAQVAEKLNTKQSAIARMENDLSGSVSLRRYVEMAAACGMVPLEITLVPVDELREYVIANPDAPRTADAFQQWKNSLSAINGEVVASSSVQSNTALSYLSLP